MKNFLSFKLWHENLICGKKIFVEKKSEKYLRFIWWEIMSLIGCLRRIWGLRIFNNEKSEERWNVTEKLEKLLEENFQKIFHENFLRKSLEKILAKLKNS